jgi:hypothetical protein
MAMVTERAAPESAQDLLEPATSVKSVTVFDSKVNVSHSFYAYWLDDETVIFDAETDETWEHWSPLRQVPVVRVTTWNVRTNEIRYHGETSGYLCVFERNVLFKTYRKTQAGDRVRSEGRYVDDVWYGGIFPDARMLGAEDAASLNKSGIDTSTCQPAAKGVPIPPWIASSKAIHHRLPDGFGIKVHRRTEQDSTETLICSVRSETRDDCSVLTVPGHGFYTWSFVSHLDLVLLSGQSQLNNRPIVVLLDRARGVRWYALNDRHSMSPASALATRIGFLLVLTNSGSPYVIGDGGLWLWNRGERRRLYVTAAGLSKSVQGSVSPNGCLIAFSGNERPYNRTPTLRVARLCGR